MKINLFFLVLLFFTLNIKSQQVPPKSTYTLDQIKQRGLTELQKEQVDNATLLWNAKTKYYDELNNNSPLKEIFILYHFYRTNKDNNIYASQLQTLSNNNYIQDFIQKIAALESKRLIELIFPNEDSITKNYVKDKLHIKFKQLLKDKLSKQEPLYVNYQKLKLWALATEIKEEKKAAIKSKETTQIQLNARNSFLEKTKAAEIPISKAKKIWNLIIQRNKDLEAYKKRKKIPEDAFSIIEKIPAKTPQTIKKEFQEAIIALVSLKEYSLLLKEDLKPNVTEQAKKQLKEIFLAHEFTDEQKKEVYKKVTGYYYNKAANTYYYKYDKKKLKQKLSVLQFYFKKQYKNLMTSYGIDVANTQKKGTNSTYEW